MEHHANNTTYFIKIESPYHLSEKESIKLCFDGDEDIYEVRSSHVYPSDRIRIKMSELEKIQKRKRYREEYRNRPDVIERRLRQSQCPERKKKRQEYAKDPKVKLRKRETSRIRRILLREYIKRCPELEKTLREKAAKKATKTKEHQKSDSE